MKSAALVALLPLLATLSTALPSPPAPRDEVTGHVRKSLSFGPKHDHARFEILEVGPVSEVGLLEHVDVNEVARRFIGEKLGGVDGFYIRDDTYTDERTGVTHVYARQLINGLEVSDGDINLNIDRYGRVISYGTSFHNGPIPSLDNMSKPAKASNQFCSTLRSTLDSHQAVLDGTANRGPWGLVKSAAQVILPGLISPEPAVDQHEAAKVNHNIKSVHHHIDALCSTDTQEETFLDPVSALITLLPKLSPVDSMVDLSQSDFTSTPHHTLAPKPAPAEPPTEVISGPGLAKSGVVNEVSSRLMYTQTEGEPRLVWKFEVEMQDSWYEAYVDAQTAEILRIVDWAHDFSWNNEPKADVESGFKGGKQKPLPIPEKKLKPYTYHVYPWGVNDPSVGNTTLEHKPWDTVASPSGWHEVPSSANPWTGQRLPGMNVTHNTTTFYTTIGNNVIAHEDWEGQNNYLLNYRPISNNLTFVYDYGEPEGLAPKEYIDFVVTQLFYTSNKYHDLVYRLGFDEVAGNFQLANFDKGGRGGDPVIANAQDGSGYNNANFMTPPDGTSGRMRMYVWDTATPYRDGDIEAGIVIHELSHGLSTRITGGPMNSGCLGYGEAGGMGEGWGDALATLIRQIEEHGQFKNGTDVYSMGSWAANRGVGIRNFMYSTNSTVNPSTYKTLDKPGYWGVHAIGEVWAELLFVVSQRLVEKYGFSSTLFPPTNTSEPNDYYTKTSEESVDAFGKKVPLVPKHGNTLAIQLIVDGMKLQPCRPSFFDARNAIVQADEILTGGENACLIWKAFAERGLGQDANVIGQTPWGGGIRNDGHQIPTKACKSEDKPKHPKHSA